MSTKSLHKQVGAFIKKKEGNDIALAKRLGYKVPGTLKAWVKKGRVPDFRREDVKIALAALKGF